MGTDRDRGYLPIRDYAAIGDGRTVALIGSDGAVDWLCLPDLDSPSVFGALLDTDRGGRFTLAPTVPYEVRRRYVPHTNILETTFTTSGGSVRVTDALTLPGGELSPYRELARRIDVVAGTVPMEWRVEPRFQYGSETASFTVRGGVPVAASGRDALAVLSWEAGTTTVDTTGVGARFVAQSGCSSMLVMSVAHLEPLVFPTRADVEDRLAGTARRWEAWSESRAYDGAWRDAVLRSALALKLLVFAPSGAIAAAPTTSLPEQLGGTRNWDYRFSWPRDSAFTLRALLSLGCAPEARAFFFWLLHASQLTHPHLHVLYRLNGRVEADERELPLAGYHDSTPVRVGNGAAEQLQLDVYGEMLAAAALYARFAGGLDRDHGRRLAEVANLVCELWREPDAGIWEVRSEPAHFTQSKMMCAVALDHAVQLAESGHLPNRDVARWQRESASVRKYVETNCFSEEKQAYARIAGEDEVDASLLLAVVHGYDRADSPRLVGTVDAVRRELADGPLVRRYLGGDGLPGEDGAFLACSFWMVEALARQGRVGEATTMMGELVELANDVGLYAEEIDPTTGDYLGNFPQGLSHLALVNAAVTLEEAAE
ncbi:MAG TPA: glycoside hydrolase family 15 protein [Gaiella sp.]|uniref:glycoside hydrolase family 15 protein n=1 Tax=Gaiella sp. TaxID=2663207 RepID=UPI002D7EA9E0|nr:glycoside hydrolase family 15 protein [Gaiella sp.]HET9286538.1 glycoside hydrolase family 15 protein [Gaiella sp.]